MEKTKLGISAAFFSAAVCLMALYGGYVIVGIAVGYVLLKEESVSLKRFCVKVLALMLIFSVAFTALNLVPDLLDTLFAFLRIFGVGARASFIENVFSLLNKVLSLIHTVAFLLLGACMLFGKNVRIPGIDGLIEKHIN